MRRLILCALMIFITGLMSAQVTGKVYILCYHTFLGTPNSIYDFAPSVFEQHLQDISDLGYRFVSFDEILNNSVSGNKNVLITIDDAHRTLKTVKPILEKFHIVPIAFTYVSPLLAQDWHYLSFDELITFRDNGYTMGGHGFYHEAMSEKFYRNDPRGFEKEIYTAKNVLERHLGQTVNLWAFPYGQYSETAIRLLKDAGYVYGFTLIERAMLLPIRNEPELMKLPRYLMTKGEWKRIYKVLKDND